MFSVVDLTGARFMAPGNIRDVDQTHLRDVRFELLDQISELALLVIDVVEHLHVRVIDGLGDLKCLASPY